MLPKLLGALPLLLLVSPRNTNAAFLSGPSSSNSVMAFSSTPKSQHQSQFMGRGMRLVSSGGSSSSRGKHHRSNGRRSELGMFLGSEGGILGVGAPEVAVTLLVGYFILGPSDLYKLTKEIGKFIQNFRTLSSEASKQFESTMEDQLELTELRKAQSELNDAFGFRRSINVDQDAEAFSAVPRMNEPVAEAGAAAAATATADTAMKKKRRKRKRVKKKVKATEEASPSEFSGEIPDLDMSKAFADEVKEQTNVDLPSALEGTRQDPDWFSASESDIASEVLAQQPLESSTAEASRFASQLSGDWNQQVLDNEEQLSPLAKVMERIALLEEERKAENERLEEEFRLRKDIDEKYYREKRAVLEEAATEISMAAYGGLSDDSKAENDEISDDNKNEKEKLIIEDVDEKEEITSDKAIHELGEESLVTEKDEVITNSTLVEKDPVAVTEKEEKLPVESVNGEQKEKSI